MSEKQNFGYHPTVVAFKAMETLGDEAPAWAREILESAEHPGCWGDRDLDNYTRSQLVALLWDDRMPRELHADALARIVADGFDDSFGRDDLAGWLDRFSRVNVEFTDLYLLLDDEARVEHASRMAGEYKVGRDNLELAVIDGVTLTAAHVAKFVKRGGSYATCAMLGLVPDGGFVGMLNAPASKRAYKAADRVLVGIAALLAGETLDVRAAKRAFGGGIAQSARARVADGENFHQGRALENLIERCRNGAAPSVSTEVAEVLNESSSDVVRTIAAALGVLDAAGLHALVTEVANPLRYPERQVKGVERTIVLNDRAVEALTINTLDPDDAMTLFTAYRFPASQALVHTTVSRDQLVDALTRWGGDAFRWIAGEWTANPYDREVLAEVVQTEQWSNLVARTAPLGLINRQAGPSLDPWRDLLELDTSVETLRLVVAVPGTAAAVAERLGDMTADEVVTALGTGR